MKAIGKSIDESFIEQEWIESQKPIILENLLKRMNPPLNPDFSTPLNLPDFSGLDLDFEIIDAHHHLFDLDQVYYP